MKQIRWFFESEGNNALCAPVKTYQCVIERGEDGWYVVSFPELPGCLTQGKSIEEVEKNASEALALYLEDMNQYKEI